MAKDMRDTYFDLLYKYGQKHDDVIVITADADAFGLRQFKKDMPDRFINIGVTEQNMMNVACGLAMRDKKVFVYSIIPFLTLRAFEQIKFNISGMNLPIRLIGVGTGFSFAFDGPSHHGIIDVGVMRTIPQMEIYNPCDENSTWASFHMMNMAMSASYIRLDKGVYPDIYSREDIFDTEERLISQLDFNIFKYLTDKKNSEVLVISTGYTTHIVKDYIDKQNKYIDKIDFIDVYKLKEFPELKLENYKHIIVVDENSCVGGLFTIMSEQIAINGHKSKIHPITVKDTELLKYGSREYLLGLNNITVERLDALIERIFNEI